MKYINLSTKNLKSEEFFLTYPRLFWHEGLIYKLKQNGIKGNLTDILTNFLNDKKQRVILTLFRMEAGGGGAKSPPTTSFSPVTSTNVGIGP